MQQTGFITVIKIQVFLKANIYSHTVIHTQSWYLSWSSLGLSEWPWWAHSAGNRTSTDNLGHRTVSSLLSTSQTLWGYPGLYNSHTAPPSGQKGVVLEHWFRSDLNFFSERCRCEAQTLKNQSWNFLAQVSLQKSRVVPPNCRVMLFLQSWLQWLQLTHFKPNLLIKSCLNNSLHPGKKKEVDTS